MNVELSLELEQLVQARMQSGLYRSPSEVIEEALRLLDHQDQNPSSNRDDVRKAIEEGWQSARRGEFVDCDEVFDRLDSELEPQVLRSQVG